MSDAGCIAEGALLHYGEYLHYISFSIYYYIYLCIVLAKKYSLNDKK